MLYCERETYTIQNLPDCVDKIDDQMAEVLMSTKKVELLWDLVRDLILERLTRKPIRRRQNVVESKLLEWVECMDPEIELSDLPDYSKERIENIDELI